ncbi:MAG: hypothetical protein O3A46_11005 [Candidatus Poribacteria bacterium]|nr:hypothetical protein [Candidatus Poribacteria bacterium]
MSVRYHYVVLFALMCVAVHSVNAKILFADDFESDAIGAEPSKWQLIGDPIGDPPGAIVKDPAGGANQAFVTSLRGDKNGRIYLAGEADWDDIVVKFDWYLAVEGVQLGTVFRYQDRANHYLIDRRAPANGNSINIYSRINATWVQLGATPNPTDTKTWYTILLTLKGDSFEAKMKLRDDDTSFADLPALVMGQDGTFKTGYFGTYGAESPDVAFYDNVVIGETVAEVEAPLSVSPADRLPTAWGKLKRSR